MSKLFVKDRIIPEHIIDDIMFDAQMERGKPSGVTGKGSKDTDRISISRRLRPDSYMDLCILLQNFCREMDPKHDPNTLIVKELEHLEYGINGHFKAHIDVVSSKSPRRFSTVTLLSKTEDLEGGDLIVYDKDENQINTNLEVGETVLFYSTTVHKVTPITKGGREVLVGWIYDR